MFSENKGSAIWLASGLCHSVFNQWYWGFVVSAFHISTKQVIAYCVHERGAKIWKRIEFPI